MGLLHSRLRFLTLKSPQVALHSDQCPQELQPPSTSLSTQEKKHVRYFCTFCFYGGNFEKISECIIELDLAINRQSKSKLIAKIILHKNWERLIARLKK